MMEFCGMRGLPYIAIAPKSTQAPSGYIWKGPM